MPLVSEQFNRCVAVQMSRQDIGSYRAYTLWRSLGKLINPWAMGVRAHAEEALLSLRFSCLSKIHSAAVVTVRLRKLSAWACPIPVPFGGTSMSGLEDTKFHCELIHCSCFSEVKRRLGSDILNLKAVLLGGGNSKLSCEVQRKGDSVDIVHTV